VGSSVISKLPLLTRLPATTSTVRTLPATVVGTSRVALSDSSVAIESLRDIKSPGFTSNSMIGISAKSPISGTRTSTLNLAAFIASMAALNRRRLNTV
jgi:hypothetical protein